MNTKISPRTPVPAARSTQLVEKVNTVSGRPHRRRSVPAPRAWLGRTWTRRHTLRRLARAAPQQRIKTQADKPVSAFGLVRPMSSVATFASLTPGNSFNNTFHSLQGLRCWPVSHISNSAVAVHHGLPLFPKLPAGELPSRHLSGCHGPKFLQAVVRLTGVFPSPFPLHPRV